MPLPSPILDDRSYQQLRDELVRRIPVYAPEWTDHNASDPGITLIELFAFLGENLLFRFNQIPETTKLAFLKLLRIPLRPAVPARAMVMLERTDSGPGSARRRDRRSRHRSEGGQRLVRDDDRSRRVAADRGGGRAHRRAGADAARRRSISPTPSIDALDGLGDSRSRRTTRPSTCRPTRPIPRPSPVNVRAAVDGALWIAVLRTKTTDIDASSARALINIGFVPDEEIVGDHRRRRLPRRDAGRQRPGDDLAGEHADRDGAARRAS